MSKIIVSCAGWCEADPDKVRFQYIGPEQYGLMSTGGTITGTEWLALSEDDREDYILECTGTAFATAVDGEYDQVDIEVEDD